MTITLALSTMLGVAASYPLLRRFTQVTPLQLEGMQRLGETSAFPLMAATLGAAFRHLFALLRDQLDRAECPRHLLPADCCACRCWLLCCRRCLMLPARCCWVFLSAS